MKKYAGRWNTGWLLLGFTGVFLCVLLGLHLHDRAAFSANGVETERSAGIETVRSKPADIDLNTAGQAELETLPGIGPELAKRIIAYRETEGAFAAAEDLMKVSGIGEKKFAALKDYITVKEGNVP